MTDANGKSYRNLTVNCEKRDKQPVPFIKLQGKWLGKFGFQQGDKIRVERQPGLLIIRQLGEQATSRAPELKPRMLWYCLIRILCKKFNLKYPNG